MDQAVSGKDKRERGEAGQRARIKALQATQGPEPPGCCGRSCIYPSCLELTTDACSLPQHLQVLSTQRC